MALSAAWKWAIPNPWVTLKVMNDVRQWLRDASSIAVLTGAGVSAESGVPTFRGGTLGDQGLWKQYRAEELATPGAFARDPKLVWEWYDWRRSLIAEAKPNPGHYALAAAEAAESAGAQGKFWPMYDLLFERTGKLGNDHLRACAERIGMDMARYTAEMDDEIYRQRVREHLAGGRASGVRATPTFFINGKLFDVSFGIHTLSDAVAAALK